MNVAIVYRGSYPSSRASANHILSLAKGLKKRDVKVTILCMHPYIDSDNNPDGVVTRGAFEGVDYYFPADTCFWPKGKFSYFKKMAIKYNSYKGLLTFIKKQSVSVALFYSPPVVSSLLFKLICRKTKVKFVIERTELPEIYKNPEKFVTPIKRIYAKLVKWSFSLPDAWILETQTLVDYYKQYAKRNASFYKLPMTVEIDRFVDVKAANNEFGDYIAYCGNMLEDDGVSILINAFKLINEDYPNLNLVLAGTSKDVPQQKKLAQRLGIKERVYFLGRVPRDYIPSFLAGAKVLALASPTSLRSTATMPCKVGEYLCTGVPVVVTGLGEINTYLKDGVSAYLSKPDSPVSFASKMKEALDDTKENRQRITEEGKRIAKTFFSADSQTTTLLEILSSIVG